MYGKKIFLVFVEFYHLFCRLGVFSFPVDMRKFLEFCFGHVIHIFTSLLLLYLCLPQRSFLPHFTRVVQIRDAGRTFPLLRKIRCRRKTADSTSETRENNERHLVCRERFSLICTYAAPYQEKVLRTILRFCLKSFSVIDQRAFGVGIYITRHTTFRRRGKFWS